VLHALDHALNVFRHNEGHLAVAEIRARSLITVTRADLAQALSDACHERELGTELFIDGHAFPRADGPLDQQRTA
jgi:hypothetical protein